MTDTDKRLRVGAIVTTHGLRGELKVYPTTDDPDRFRDLKECMVETKEGVQILHPERVKFFKQFVIIKFKEYDNINDVLGFVKKDLLIETRRSILNRASILYVIWLGIRYIQIQMSIWGP